IPPSVYRPRGREPSVGSARGTCRGAAADTAQPHRWPRCHAAHELTGADTLAVASRGLTRQIAPPGEPEPGAWRASWAEIRSARREGPAPKATRRRQGLEAPFPTDRRRRAGPVGRATRPPTLEFSP